MKIIYEGTQGGNFDTSKKVFNITCKHVVFFCNLLNYMVVNGDGVNCGLITLYGFRAGGASEKHGLNRKNTFLNCIYIYI